MDNQEFSESQYAEEYSGKNNFCVLFFLNKPKSSSEKASKKDSEEEGKSSTVPLTTKKTSSGKSKTVKIQQTSKWYGLLIFLPSIF